MVAERVNSSQKLLDMGEKGVYFSYTLVKANQHYDSSTAGCCGVYWRRNGLELLGKGDGCGELVDVDLRNDALYTGYARIRAGGCNLVASEIIRPV